MSQRAIIEYPDPRLRERAAPVKSFDSELARLLDDLGDTLRATRAIGMAAPQLGDVRQVLVIDLSGGADMPEEFVNPRLVESALPGLVEESCLSVPGVVGEIIRHTRVKAQAQDRRGEWREIDLEGMRAVCLLHEMDHLAGRLFIDRMNWLQRLRIRSQLARPHERRTGT